MKGVHPLESFPRFHAWKELSQWTSVKRRVPHLYELSEVAVLQLGNVETASGCAYLLARSPVSSSKYCKMISKYEGYKLGYPPFPFLP